MDDDDRPRAPERPELITQVGLTPHRPGEVDHAPTTGPSPKSEDGAGPSSGAAAPGTWEPTPAFIESPTVDHRGGTIVHHGAAGATSRPKTEVAPPTDVLQQTVPDGDFQRARHEHVGTVGGEDLSAPERTSIRLVAGGPLPGTRYRLVRWLGEGGMGVVYEAEHVDIERRVALKILRFDLSRQPSMTKIFRDEARAASKMGAVNVVEVYDFGELADGRLFFCMELLAGEDLVPASEESWIPPERLIPILRQICKGLYAAHQAGVVHRDVKPENVLLVTKEGRADFVKIVDFGISAILAGGRAHERRVSGTPHYMAPEQVRCQPFDGRLDMYAVGCMAYELLVGVPPFTGATLDDVLQAHVEQEAAKPTKIRPERKIPPALEAVVLRCLEKSADARFADMADLEAALCEAQIAAGVRTAWDDLPLPEVDPERRERLRREMPHPLRESRRSRWLWPAVAAFSGLVAISAITYAYVTREPTTAEERVIEALTNEARAAAALNHYMVGSEAEPDLTAYRKVLALEALTGAAERAASERGGRLRREFADTLVALGDRFWDVDGARYFAVEYYLWARAFDPDHLRARERSVISDTEFGVFLHNAATGGFTANEKAMIEVASAVADKDQRRRDDRLAMATRSMNPILRERLALYTSGLERSTGVSLAAEPGPPASVPPPVEPPPVEPVDEGTTTGGDTTGPATTSTSEAASDSDATEGADTEGVKEPGRTTKPIVRKPLRDPKKAQELAQSGLSALQAGRRAEAEGLFHQALSFDNRSAVALMGLSDIAFDTGKRQKALDYAERAVEANPNSKGYRIKLGDAYFALLRYRDALKHYETAKRLGDASAEGRIAKVKAKLGEG
ncbi:MAG: serine/threonine-protein kinase [Nannocystaceae bacterium]